MNENTIARIFIFEVLFLSRWSISKNKCEVFNMDQTAFFSDKLFHPSWKDNRLQIRYLQSSKAPAL